MLLITSCFSRSSIASNIAWWNSTLILPVFSFIGIVWRGILYTVVNKIEKRNERKIAKSKENVSEKYDSRTAEQ